MSNNCAFAMKVVGTADNIHKLCEWMAANYDYWQTPDGEIHVQCSSDRHFYRLEDVYIASEDNGSAIITGRCASAVRNCMFADAPVSYYSMTSDIFATIRKHIDLIEATKLLDLDVEIYGGDSVCSLAEHIVVSKGEIKTDQFTRYCEYSLKGYSSKAKAEVACQTEISDEDWNRGIAIECEWYPWTYSI